MESHKRYQLTNMTDNMTKNIDFGVNVSAFFRKKAVA